MAHEDIRGKNHLWNIAEENKQDELLGLLLKLKTVCHVFWMDNAQFMSMRELLFSFVLLVSALMIMLWIDEFDTQANFCVFDPYCLSFLLNAT